MNRVRRVLVLVVLLGFLTPTWSGDLAQAGHENNASSSHEPPPTPPSLDTVANGWDASCVISYGQGRNLPTGLPEQRGKHQHIVGFDGDASFGGLTACEADTRFEFAGEHHFMFAVGSDGPGECDGIDLTRESCDSNHGARGDAGWSHSSCYDDDSPKGAGDCSSPDLYDGWGDPLRDGCVNCGEFVFPESTEGFAGHPDWKGRYDSPRNWMMFCRGVYDLDADGMQDCSNGVNRSTGGNHVLAWGALYDDWYSEYHCFLAELELVPSGEMGWFSFNNFSYSGIVHFSYGDASDHYCRGSH